MHRVDTAPEPVEVAAGGPIALEEFESSLQRRRHLHGGDGAPEGEYIITVQWRKLVKRGADLVQGPNVIPAKYSRPQTSDIVRKIAAGPNKLEPINL